jgi:hypothetical protein
LMDNLSPSTLLNSISCLGALTSDVSTVRPKPIQKYCKNVYDISSIVNPLVEDLCKSPEEQLNEVLKDLDTAVNEASGLIGNWHQTTSKIYFVSAYDYTSQYTHSSLVHSSFHILCIYVFDLCFPRKINLLFLTAVHPFQFLLGSWFPFDSLMWKISIIHAFARYKCFTLSVSITI